MFKKKNKKPASMARNVIVQEAPKSVISEQFRTVRANINFSMPDDELKTLLITSASPSEGKSTVAANIASVFAQEGKRVLLIDGDMRKPTAHHTFKIRNANGLSSVLTKQCKVEESIQKTQIVGLSIIPSGAIPPNPSELLLSQQMNSVLEELKSKYDLIVFDAPPLLSVADSQILSNKCDATALVINTGVTEKASLQKAKDVLEISNANILGVIMNNFKLEKDHYYYYYYGSEE